MHKLRSKEIFSDTKLLVMAIEEIQVLQDATSTYCQNWGRMKCLTTIVCEPHTIVGLDIDARRSDVDWYRRQLPESNAAILRFYLRS